MKIRYCPHCGGKDIKIVLDKKRSDNVGNGGILEEAYDTIRLCTCKACGNKWIN